MADIKVVILAGGQGSRFWPISRMKHPKQFLSVSNDGESLIQATARRVETLAGKDNILVITNILHEPLVKEHVSSAQVVSEPIGRNTAASIGIAALHAKRDYADPVMIVLPADHTVKDEVKLRETLWDAIDLAESEDVLVTVGITPHCPETGYGYIQKGAALKDKGFMVSRFYEKPNIERAQEYIESGDFFWNSGMFVWRASVFLKAVKEFMPELDAGLKELEDSIGSPQEVKVCEKILKPLKSVSVDFGILEHARNCALVEAKDFGWNDVGSWDVWAEHFDTDKHGNFVHGDATIIDSKNCVVYSKDKMIGIVGGESLVVIDSEDAILVCPRNRVQDVRQIVDELKKGGRKDLI